MLLRCGQVYKFLYASRLLDCGLASQAFHYCEVVGQAILRQKEPFFVLTGEVIKVITHPPIHTCLLYIPTMSYTFEYCSPSGFGVYRVSSTQMYVSFPLQLSDRLRHSEGQFSEAGVSGAGQEPDWLKHLRERHHSLQASATCKTDDIPISWALHVVLISKCLHANGLKMVNMVNK